MRNIIPVSYEILSVSFFAGSPPRKFVNLSEQELNQLVEAKALGTRRRAKTTTNWSVTRHCGNIRENF